MERSLEQSQGSTIHSWLGEQSSSSSHEARALDSNTFTFRLPHPSPLHLSIYCPLVSPRSQDLAQDDRLWTAKRMQLEMSLTEAIPRADALPRSLELSPQHVPSNPATAPTTSSWAGGSNGSGVTPKTNPSGSFSRFSFGQTHPTAQSSTSSNKNNGSSCGSSIPSLSSAFAPTASPQPSSHHTQTSYSKTPMRVSQRLMNPRGSVLGGGGAAAGAGGAPGATESGPGGWSTWGGSALGWAGDTRSKSFNSGGGGGRSGGGIGGTSGWSSQANSPRPLARSSSGRSRKHGDGAGVPLTAEALSGEPGGLGRAAANGPQLASPVPSLATSFATSFGASTGGGGKQRESLDSNGLHVWSSDEEDEGAAGGKGGRGESKEDTRRRDYSDITVGGLSAWGMSPRDGLGGSGGLGGGGGCYSVAQNGGSGGVKKGGYLWKRSTGVRKDWKRRYFFIQVRVGC